MSNFYLTTSLPYINSKPHLGHAAEFVQGDCRCRFEKLRGNEVFFNLGTDEHGEKILKKAEELGVDVKKYADDSSAEFKKLVDDLSIEPTRFIRTTDEDHRKVAQKFWEVCLENGDIYKQKHSGLYCIGCELYLKERDLNEKNECNLHPGVEVKRIEEENYFFRFSKYKDDLLKLYENDDFIIPPKRLGEIKSFVERGLEDISISREKSKLSWGIPVPNDDEQVIYVWFDALINYITTIGWPDGDWEKWWGGVQIAGKDNLRQQAAIWQSMLLSAKIKPSKQIFIHGFITSGGRKMSKTVGNVIDPNELISRYGKDATRYLLLKVVNPYEDTDITNELLDRVYSSDLVNGIGNLFSRISKMASDNIDSISLEESDIESEYTNAFEKFDFKRVCEFILRLTSELDERIAKKEPFKVIKTNRKEGVEEIKYLLQSAYKIAILLRPIMPETSEKLIKDLKELRVVKPIFEKI